MTSSCQSVDSCCSYADIVPSTSIFALSAAIAVQLWRFNRSFRKTQTDAPVDSSSSTSSHNVNNYDAQHLPLQSMRLVRYLSEHSDNSSWKIYTDDHEVAIQTLPKIELHVHLDGAIDPDFLWRYLQQHPESISRFPTSVDLPWEPGRELKVKELVSQCETAGDFHRLCTCRGHQSLKAMLNCFEIFLPLIRRNTSLLEQVGYDFVQRQHEQNVVYTEVRYSPFLLADEFNQSMSFSLTQSEIPVTADDAFHAVTTGLRRGCAKFNIVVNQIISAITWRPDWATPSLEMALQYQDALPCAVVGIDIAAGEEHFDAVQFPHLHRPHYDMIQIAQQHGIPITIHAGESTDQATANIETAILEYGAWRIGHGYRMFDQPDIVALVKERDIHVEACPTSSFETGGWITSPDIKDWTQHPITSMKKAGLSWSLSSDDPAVFHTSLAWQYRIAIAKMNLTMQDLFDSNWAAVAAAFCPNTTKEQLRLTLRQFGLDNDLHVQSDYVVIHNSKSECQLPRLLSNGVATNPSESRSWRRSVSDTFCDRVYISSGVKM